MSTTQSGIEIPNQIAAGILLFAVLSAFYSILIGDGVQQLTMLWLAGFSMIVSLFVVYLFYRFVLAVETIARKM
jgi:hypothetical protein